MDSYKECSECGELHTKEVGCDPDKLRDQQIRESLERSSTLGRPLPTIGRLAEDE